MRKLVIGFILAALLFVKPCFSADQWDKLDPAGSANPGTIDTLQIANNEALDRLTKNYREGCEIEYLSTSTLTVALGETVCSNSAGSIRRWRSNTSNTTVSWTNIDTGAEAASTTYYVWAVADTDVTTFTIMISLSSTAPTGATYYKRLGYFYNNASSNILDDETIVNDNNYYPDSYLGDWESKSDSVSYQASTDGFVVATSSGSATVLYGYTDSANPPTTVRAAHGDSVSTHGISMPVKKLDYYKVTGATAVFWIGLE